MPARETAQPAARHGEARPADHAPGAGEPGAWCADALDGQQDGTARGGTEHKRPGRPRSERAEQAIIEAALAAFAEHGIDGVRCEDVAARAGVGKATLYRRWPGKEDLLIAALAATKSPLPEPQGTDVRADLIAMVDAMARDASDPRFARQFALLHGEGERYPRLMARYAEAVIEPRRALIRTALQMGIEAGQLRPDLDIEVAVLTLTGATMSRGKLTPGARLAPDFAQRVVDQLLAGIAAR